jgi:hypothetical protein
MFPKKIYFAQLGIYILNIHHSKRDLKYIVRHAGIQEFPDLNRTL